MEAQQRLFPRTIRFENCNIASPTVTHSFVEEIFPLTLFLRYSDLKIKSEAMEFLLPEWKRCVAHSQLTELSLADRSAGGQAKHEAKYGKQQKHHSVHQPSPLWQF